MSTEIRAAILDSAATLQRMAEDAEAVAAIAGIVDLSVAALRAGGKLLFCGNGGSAADAQHWPASWSPASTTTGRAWRRSP